MLRCRRSLRARVHCRRCPHPKPTQLPHRRPPSEPPPATSPTCAYCNSRRSGCASWWNRHQSRYARPYISGTRAPPQLSPLYDYSSRNPDLVSGVPRPLAPDRIYAASRCRHSPRDAPARMWLGCGETRGARARAFAGAEPLRSNKVDCITRKRVRSNGFLVSVRKKNHRTLSDQVLIPWGIRYRSLNHSTSHPPPSEYLFGS